jgi:hypothetical protein
MNIAKTGSGDKILDWVVIIGAVLLFLKTADVLSYFAPTNLSEIVGMEMSLIYGIVSALLVEGAALALHFNHRAHLSSTAQLVKWALIVISGLCQLFDGYLATGNESQMSETMKFGLQFGVPLVPLIVLVLLFAVGRLPDDGSVQRPFPGIKNIAGPAWNRFWNGDRRVTAFPLETSLPILDPDNKEFKPQTNPTKGER